MSVYVKNSNNFPIRLVVSNNGSTYRTSYVIDANGTYDIIYSVNERFIYFAASSENVNQNDNCYINTDATNYPETPTIDSYTKTYNLSTSRTISNTTWYLPTFSGNYIIQEQGKNTYCNVFIDSTKEVAKTFSITGSVTNGSYTYTPDDLTGSSDITVTFTANSGYEFNTSPVITYNETDTITATIASDKQTATAVITSAIGSAVAENSGIFTISGTAEQIKTFSITGSVTNGSYTYTPDDLTGNSDITVTFTANSGYEFNTSPVITYNETDTITATIASDKQTATAVITSAIGSTVAENSGIFTISGTADKQTVIYNYTIRNTQVNNVTYTYTDKTLTCGIENTFTFTANSGYEFNTAPYITYYDDSGYTHRIDSTLASDKLTATATVTADVTSSLADTTGNYLNIYATAAVITPISTAYGFITLYNPTVEEMKTLASKRYYTDNTQVVDLGNYIQSVKKFYCDVPTTNKQNIILGVYDTNVNSLVVDNDIIEFNCGSVTLESTNENNNDYDNLIYAFLPFIGKETLDSSIIMNRTINIKYIINFISGSVVANVYANEQLIYSFDGSASQEIPYILNASYNILGNLNYPNNILYNYQPEILVLYHENYNDNGNVIVDDNKFVLLSTLSGFNSVEDVIINNDNLTTDEINLITSYLNNGIWF